MASENVVFRMDEGFPRARPREKWTWPKILVVLVFILVAFNAAGTVLYFIRETGKTEVAVCDDGRECTLGTLDPDDTCHLAHKSAATACSQCYTSKTGHCDPASGECVGGEPTDCYGWCDTDSDDTCDNLWQFSAEWLDVTFTAPETICFANECTGMVSFAVFEDDPFFFTDGATARCEEMLDATFYAANKSCISMERYVQQTWTNDFGLDWHACVYRWTCAQANQTWMEVTFDSMSSSSSSLGDLVAKQLGVSSASDIPADRLADLTAKKARLDQAVANHANLLPSKRKISS